MLPSWPASSCSASAYRTFGGHRLLDLGPLARGAQLRRLDEVDRVGLALGLQPPALVLGRGLELAGGGLLLHAAALVGALLGDELLVAAGELDPVGELVLGDRALVLDRGRAAGERRLVGAGLDLLARGLLQRLLDLGRRRHLGHADGDELQAELLERRLLGQAAADPRADRRDALGEDRAQLARGELVDDELLGELRQQAADLLERLRAPTAGLQVDGEVDPGREPGGVGDAERDRALHGHALEVRAAGVEEKRQLAVVDRDLGDGGRDRAKPEGQPGAVGDEPAAAVAHDVRRRLGPQVAEHGNGDGIGDVGHDGPPG